MAKESRNRSTQEIILEWSEKRRNWQRDALRRIVADGSIPDEGIDELLRLCKIDHGYDDPDVEAEILTREDLSSNPNQEENVRLLSLENVIGVNQLAEDQKLTFAERGLTIIYGENGTGKSGYARLLKRACRARHAGEIIPDIYKPSPSGVAEATIKVKIGDGRPEKINWKDTGQPHKILSAISIYDKDCGSVHITESTDVAYRPFGLDIPHELVNVSNKIKSRLETERSAIETSQNGIFSSPTWTPDTTVGLFISRLTYESNIDEFNALGKLNEKQRKRKKSLEVDLQMDPEKAALEYQKRADSINHVVEAIKLIANYMSDESLNHLMECSKNARKKREVSIATAKSDFSDLPLLGIGGDAWRDLWEAARRYAENNAYEKQEPFPPGKGGICVLCLTPVDDTAEDRMQSFENFIRQDINKQAATAEEELAEKLDIFLDVTNKLDGFEELVKSTHFENTELCDSVLQFFEIARLRQATCNSLLKGGGDAALSSWSTSPLNDLIEYEKSLRQRAKQMNESSDPEKRKKLMGELNELMDRDSVSNLSSIVKTEVDRLGKLHILDLCIKDLDTNAITRLGGKIADEVVTPQVKNKFEEEITWLASNRMSVEVVRSGGRQGAPQFQLKFKNSPNEKIQTILSDGEQSCVAIAAFLTELATAPHNSALIFDDPVSSIDNIWQRRVAERLVKEASRRQVIVFSHDLVFLNNLIHAAGSDVTVKTLSLQRVNDATGVVQPDLPWDGKSVEDRLDKLEKRTREAGRKLNEDGDTDKYRLKIGSIYGDLRATWERSIEDIVFSNVINRNREYINRGDLINVTVIDRNDCDIFSREYDKCNERTGSHDSSRQKRSEMYTKEEVLKDISTFKDWIIDIKTRQKNLK